MHSMPRSGAIRGEKSQRLRRAVPAGRSLGIMSAKRAPLWLLHRHSRNHELIEFFRSDGGGGASSADAI